MLAGGNTGGCIATQRKRELISDARFPMVSVVVSRMDPQGPVQRHRCGGEGSSRGRHDVLALGEALTHVLSRRGPRALGSFDQVATPGRGGSERHRESRSCVQRGRKPTGSVRVNCDPIRPEVNAIVDGAQAPDVVVGIPRGSRATGAVSERSSVGLRGPGGNTGTAPKLAPSRCSS